MISLYGHMGVRRADRASPEGVEPSPRALRIRCLGRPACGDNMRWQDRAAQSLLTVTGLTVPGGAARLS